MGLRYTLKLLLEALYRVLTGSRGSRLATSWRAIRAVRLHHCSKSVCKHVKLFLVLAAHGIKNFAEVADKPRGHRFNHVSHFPDKNTTEWLYPLPNFPCHVPRGYLHARRRALSQLKRRHTTMYQVHRSFVVQMLDEICEGAMEQRRAGGSNDSAQKYFAHLRNTWRIAPSPAIGVWRGVPPKHAAEWPLHSIFCIFLFKC